MLAQHPWPSRHSVVLRERPQPDDRHLLGRKLNGKPEDFMANSNKVSLKGSERTPMPGAQMIGATDPQQLIEISVVLKRRQALNLSDHLNTKLSHSNYAKQYGADPADIEKIRKFAKECNLEMLERGDETNRRTVTLAGTAGAMEKAFGVELHDYEHEDGSYRGRTGTIQIPTEYANCIEGVFGLDDRIAARPHIRSRTTTGQAFGTRVSNTSYTPIQVGQLYNFPTTATGSGQTIALIELGGGYRPADIREYFKTLGLKAPSVKSVSVDHGKNRPSTAQSADGEVMLDIEVAGGVAHEASIVVYFAPNTSRGFQDALSTAIHDQVHRPSVISISWGAPESGWTQQSMDTFDSVAQEAAALGISITVASGDSGSSDGVNDGNNHVDFPASCPHVLACGGTTLQSVNGTYQKETVWNNGAQGGAGGGGYSSYFTRPAWQAAVVTQDNRGLPDVSGDADPQTGYTVQVDGQQMVFGGTSAVAPLWAGLIALLNQTLKTQLGFINPKLYSINQSDGFHDITVGNNGAYPARPGWDAATGLGSPVADLLQKSLASTSTTTTTASTTTTTKEAEKTKSLA
jgi:kumamolisin